MTVHGLGDSRPARRSPRHNAEAGFSLIEALVAMAIFMIVSGTALEGVFRLTRTNQTVSNRSQMHAGVRNATELLQQEVGQAGRVALPRLVRFAAALTSAGSQTVTLKAVNAAGATVSGANATAGMYVGERLTVDTGANEETVTLTNVNTANQQVTAVFALTHAINAPVNAYGGFAWGVIPQTTTNGATFTNGSTASVMKIVGDINSDGNLNYVEYSCDTTAGILYRRTMPFDATSKPTLGANMALLTNIVPNPGGTACFTYQEQSVNNVPYVVNVAITLTVETTDRDAQTGLFQRETKALLNVAPRNVFNVWQLAGLGVNNRIQPLPTTVSTLMGLP